jgi:hypothetical protein
VIEAMACGTPVVTGRAAAVAEVGAHAVEHVDPIDADTLGDALVTLTRSPQRRAELSASGLARARAFSWMRAAHQTLDIYRDAVPRRARMHGPTSDTAAPVDVLFGQAYFLRFDPKLWAAQQP